MITYKIILLIFASLILYSCKEDGSIPESLDTLKYRLDSLGSLNKSDTLISENYSEILKDFSGKTNATTKWITLNSQNKFSLSSELKGKYLIIPLFKKQIENIKNSELSDTSIIFISDKRVSFVFDIKGGGDEIQKLQVAANSLIVVKTKEIKSSNKIYLVKKYTDYLHKELKVIEFNIKCDFVEAISVNISDDILIKKFGVSAF